MMTAACIVLAAAAFAATGGDLSLRADAWEVRYAEAGSTLTLTHPASGTVVEGALSFEGKLSLAAETNRLVLIDSKGRAVGGVAFPRNGNRVGLMLTSPGPCCHGRLFFDGNVQYRADSHPGQSVPFSDEHVFRLSSGDADSRLNDTLHSPSKDEALVVRCDAMSLTSSGGGRYGLDFSLSFGEPRDASADFTVEPRFLATRWGTGAGRTPPPPVNGRIASSMGALSNFPGTRPATFYPFMQLLPIWDLAVKRPSGQMHLMAFCNWTDSPTEMTAKWDDIGEDAEHGFVAYELWSEAWLGVTHERLTVQVPPKDARLFVLLPNVGHPQFLAPAGVGAEWPLKSQTWTEDVLKTTVALAAGRRHTLRYAVPDSFKFDSISTSEGVTFSNVRLESGGRVLAVTLDAPKGVDVDLSLSFK